MSENITGDNLDGTQPELKDSNAESDATLKAEQPDFQKEIERVVTERLARERRKFSKELELAKKESIDSYLEAHGLTDEVVESLNKKDKTTLELKKKTRELEQLEAAHRKTRAKLEQETINGSILRAATGRSNAPELLVQILRDRVALDDDLLPYVHDNGDPSGLTIEQLVDDFLTKHKQLAAPRNAIAGAGSRVSTEGGNGEAKFDLNTPEGRKAAIALGFGKAGL